MEIDRTHHPKESEFWLIFSAMLDTGGDDKSLMEGWTGFLNELGRAHVDFMSLVYHSR